MALVRGLVRNPHGEKRDDRRNQVEPRMERFRKYAQTPRAQDKESLQAKQQQRGTHAEQGRALLFLDVPVQPVGKGNA